MPPSTLQVTSPPQRISVSPNEGYVSFFEPHICNILIGSLSTVFTVYTGLQVNTEINTVTQTLSLHFEKLHVIFWTSVLLKESHRLIFLYSVLDAQTNRHHLHHKDFHFYIWRLQVNVHLSICNVFPAPVTDSSTAPHPTRVSPQSALALFFPTSNNSDFKSVYDYMCVL